MVMFIEPYPYIPDPPPPPDKKSLSESLLRAVKSKDIEAARRVFDVAFWRHIGLAPDWEHLLLALHLQDKPMIRLLVMHGARWSEQEARCLKGIFPKEWAEWLKILRNSGAVVDDPGPMQASDAQSHKKMMLCIATDHAMLIAKKEPQKSQAAGTLRGLLGKKMAP